MYKVLKNGNHVQYGTDIYLADALSDLTNILLPMGTKVLCIGDGKTYIASSTGALTEFVPLGGGGGGGSTAAIDALIGPGISTLALLGDFDLGSDTLGE